SVLALDEAERIRQSGARRWMAAAVQRIARRREAHVVVRRAWSLGPAPLAEDSKAMMAWNEELLTIRAVGQAVNMGQRDRRVGKHCCGEHGQCQRERKGVKAPLSGEHVDPWSSMKKLPHR